MNRVGRQKVGSSGQFEQLITLWFTGDHGKDDASVDDNVHREFALETVVQLSRYIIRDLSCGGKRSCRVLGIEVVVASWGRCMQLATRE